MDSEAGARAQVARATGERNFIPVTEAQLVSVEGVGRYAVRLIWADGHETGMYPYEYLRELAELPECKPA